MIMILQNIKENFFFAVVRAVFCTVGARSPSMKGFKLSASLNERLPTITLIIKWDELCGFGAFSLPSMPV
jgi:hypothetical protein